MPAMRSYFSSIYSRSIKLMMTGIILLFTAGHVTAQTLNLKFKHINIGQGLSNSTVEAIYQDSKGFIWFGTRDGLNKYDGYQFTVFRNDPNNKNSISDNFIKCITEDANHNLWIGTTDGLNRFNAYTNTFVRYKHDPMNDDGLSGNSINCIYKDKKGELLISTNGNGLCFFDAGKNKFKRFAGKSGLSDIDNFEINGVFEDSKNNFWVATDKGTGLLNRTNGTLTTTFNLNNNANFRIAYPALRVQED